MAKILSHGPVPTVAIGVDPIGISATPINFSDMLVLEEGPGKTVYTDLTSPADRPSTTRFTVSSKANIYAGSSIDSSVWLPSKKGTEIYVELRQVWAVTDSVDLTYHKEFPVRAALALSVPETGVIEAADVWDLALAAFISLYANRDNDGDAGINALLHGVTEK